MSKNTDAIVIASVARTPIGAFQGAFASLAAPELGAIALRAGVERAGLAASDIDEVLMGCVLGAGVGQAPARQASLRAGLPLSAGCTTINKVCGSGLKAVMLGHDALVAGSARVVAAGGMESMTNAPYLLPKARGGQRLGHDRVLDAMFFDGLEDAYGPETKGRLMGTFAEECATAYGFTRDAQDAYAVASATRARAAVEGGAFDWETVQVMVETRNGAAIVERDEQPGRIDIAKIPTLKPAFREGGTVTAANSSSISDGAAAITLMRRSTAEAKGVAPLATILGHTTYADEPRLFPTAPIHAIRALLDKLGWEARDVDLYEINEAFAVVAMAAMRDLGLPHDKVNIGGGACALGHPIGASGARVLVTLIGALRRTGARRGIASLCIGGGEAVAMGVELA
ncbi:acetyl-CoA acetyltransferase [Rhodomicrobium udaipurense JA643]|uniref:Acetyl-CoA C-acyltransferase n=1 Tax=Rhodomicrobium udaipurense TaxID=1202716 RepID=A0A8I1GEA6_9HYPH|nr:acetyl-CoA C-acyltransferase [Rhodomicrobium udaipurense]KAI94321.1 acetyl-CoA acetyltransferase [Rhodomicrobium udaipurense JA643]MBJ7543364.1 acetyl-CoA C-acyltransferase [Rhodomicrobium udaipurense]